MLNYARECREQNIPFVYDPSQQVAFLDGDALQQSIPGATWLFGNEYELAVIEKKTGWNLDAVRERVQNLVVTHGAKGSTLYIGGEVTSVPAARVQTVVEPTGAGDAFRGGFFAAHTAGLDWLQCGKVAAICGAYALEAYGSNHAFVYLGRICQSLCPKLWSRTTTGEIARVAARLFRLTL